MWQCEYRIDYLLVCLPTFYWLPKLHKRPYKSRFISNSSHCSTIILSKRITSALTVVKDHVIKYSETAFCSSNVNYFWFIKTLPRSSKSCDCVTFRVLKYLLSTFLLYTHHCHITLSKQKCCLWSTGVSNRESKSYLCTSLKAILRLFIYKALYDQSYLGSKTTMTTGEWSCLISFAWYPLSCSERRGGSEKFKMKIYVSSGIRTHASPRHD